MALMIIIIGKFSVSTMSFNKIVLDIKAIMMYYILLIY